MEKKIVLFLSVFIEVCLQKSHARNFGVGKKRILVEKSSSLKKMNFEYNQGRKHFWQKNLTLFKEDIPNIIRATYLDGIMQRCVPVFVLCINVHSVADERDDGGEALSFDHYVQGGFFGGVAGVQVDHIICCQHVDLLKMENRAVY